MDPLIEIENLCRNFGEHRAVQDLSFELHRGEVLGLLGPNGAGKSTTLSMVAGNLAPHGGCIRINGTDLLEHPIRAKAGIGYLPETPPLYSELTADEYLHYCARLRGLTPASAKAAVRKAKARCGLESVGRRLIGNLSKGYQQRIGIAQAIVHEPAVIILDEPTVGLDPIQIREIRELIRELGREHGIILSTHILPEVQAVCSRVLILHRGRLVHSGVPGMSEGSAGSVRVRLERPPEASLLGGLSEVDAVERLDEGYYRLSLTGKDDALAEKLVRNGWGLREYNPERPGLEQIFVRLTTGEEGS